MKGNSMLREVVGILAAIATFASTVFAGDIVSSKPIIVFAYADHPSVSASIRMEADFVSMPLSIRGNQKDPARRFQIIAKAKEAIFKAAQGNRNIEIHSGPVALSSRPVSKLQVFSSSNYSSTSQAQLYILSPLSKNGKSVFQCAIAINNFIKSVRLPDNAEIDFGEIYLAVNGPEQYREALLKAITDEVAKTKASLGSDAKFTVSGLESPVFVRQADDRHVDLFLSYELAMTVDK